MSAVHESIAPLLDDPFRCLIEQRVSAYLGREWQVTYAEDRAGQASHPAAILSDGNYAVFAKLGVGSRTEAVVLALRQGWLTLDDTR